MDKRSQREIADVAGVADVTIRLNKIELFCLFVFLCFVSTHLVVSLPRRNKEKMLFFA